MRRSYPKQLAIGCRWPGVMRNPEGVDEIRHAIVFGADGSIVAAVAKEFAVDQLG